MKRLAVVLCLLGAALVAAAQEFIGCRVANGWAETPMLRTTFHVYGAELHRPTGSQVAYSVTVASLGYHEVFVNGQEVMREQVMKPAVSQLDKRALWVKYDITPYLVDGNNELKLMLGQGWGRVYGTPAAAWATVEKSSSDGKCGQVYTIRTTDSTWQASPSGYSYTGSWQPMQFGGERYDSRVKPDWRPASVYDARGIVLSQQEFNGNRVVATLTPQSSVRQSDSSVLLDFGQVVTGQLLVHFLSPMPSGHVVAIEYLDHAKALPPFVEKDVFIAGGDDHFANRFHMHAFRYVRISGVDSVQAKVFQISAVDPAQGATFECSDPRLNAIHDLVKHTLSCLTFSGYMVDCPHIERMGYGGDGNSSTMTLQTLWDVRDTYRNWMRAWSDAMQPNGELPYVAPAFRTGGGPYWSGFVVKAPWRTYLNYGDPSLIHEYYPQMKRWLEYIWLHCEDYILQPWPDNERHAWFLGDWAVPEGVEKSGESVLHASSCFISDCLADMIHMALLTGHPDDAQHYAEWRQNLNAAIHRHFYHPATHTYANGTPLDQCYALLMDIPPDSATAAAVAAQLLNDLHGKYRDHIAAGLMGVPIFTEWCIRGRQTDLMATILRQPDYPGYLNMINQGATTTWESWDCGRPGKEDRSRVHNCYNGIGIWFYQALAGIRPDPANPGYRHFFVDPQPVENLDWLRAAKPTPFGTIRVEIDNKPPRRHAREKKQLPPRQPAREKQTAFSFSSENCHPDNPPAKNKPQPRFRQKTLTLTVPPGTTATIFPGTAREQTLTAGVWQLELE